MRNRVFHTDGCYLKNRLRLLQNTTIMKAGKIATYDDTHGDKESENGTGVEPIEKSPHDNLTAIDMVRVQGEDCQLCREDETSLRSSAAQETKDSASGTREESKPEEEHTKPWWWWFN